MNNKTRYQHNAQKQPRRNTQCFFTKAQNKNLHSAQNNSKKTYLRHYNTNNTKINCNKPPKFNNPMDNYNQNNTQDRIIQLIDEWENGVWSDEDHYVSTDETSPLFDNNNDSLTDTKEEHAQHTHLWQTMDYEQDLRQTYIFTHSSITTINSNELWAIPTTTTLKWDYNNIEKAKHQCMDTLILDCHHYKGNIRSYLSLA